MKTKKSKAEIKFQIELDENNVPDSIRWLATDGKDSFTDAKAVIMSIWDGDNKNSLSIDLWTKDMMAEEMQHFTFQILDGLSKSYNRSVGDEKVTKYIQDCAIKIGKELNILK